MNPENSVTPEMTNQTTGSQTSTASYPYHKPSVWVQTREGASDLLTLHIRNLAPFQYRIADLDASFIGDECFGFKMILRDGHCNTIDDETAKKLKTRRPLAVAYTFRPDSEVDHHTKSDLVTSIMIDLHANWPRSGTAAKHANIENDFARRVIAFANHLQSVLVARYEEAKTKNTMPDYFSLSETKNSGGKIYETQFSQKIPIDTATLVTI